MITLNMLACSTGHTELRIDDDDPEQRKKMAGEIVSLISKGVTVIAKLAGGRDVYVTGYDAETNEWLIRGRKKKAPERASAKESSATAVAPIGGG